MLKYLPVTEDDIETAKTEKGAWTKRTLAKWNIDWPPVKGWKSRLLERGVLNPEYYSLNEEINRWIADFGYQLSDESITKLDVILGNPKRM